SEHDEWCRLHAQRPSLRVAHRRRSPHARADPPADEFPRRHRDASTRQGGKALKRGVRSQKSGVRILGFAIFATIASAQPNALMPTRDVNQLCTRATKLMEAGGVAVPDLRASAVPMIENVKQSCVTLQLRPNLGQPTYSILVNLRAYLALADVVPK